MKKSYISPTIESMKIVVEFNIFASSGGDNVQIITTIDEPTSSDAADARADGGWFDDDEEWDTFN